MNSLPLHGSKLAKAAVIITAAGSSIRLGLDKKKEYLALKNGQTVLKTVVKQFQNTGLFSLFVITLPPEGEDEALAALSGLDLSNVQFTAGGKTRQESVFRGLLRLEEEAPELVLIHDAARPWIAGDLIRDIYEQTKIHEACAPAVPAINALKKIDRTGFITEHLDREETRGIQTPQGFRYLKILAAHKKAATDGLRYVDDTQIYARYAGRVFTISGNPQNRKITYKHDLESRP